jgi:2,3-diphosphopglycerate-independent phosphoglycerate mutase
MGPGDIAFKCNFATVEDQGPEGRGLVVTSRRADRDFEADGPPLCAALHGLPIPGFPTLVASVRYATEHRAGVVLSTGDAGDGGGGGRRTPPWLSDAVSGTDPLKDGRPLLACTPLVGAAADPRTDPARTAAAVNAVCAAFRAVLASHPINTARLARGAPAATALLMRGCGVRVATTPLAGGEEALWSRAAVVAPTRIIRGLGASLGMAVLDAPGGTGDYRTALGAKADAAAAALLGWAKGEGGEAGKPPPHRPAFLLLHVKAVDDAGHDRDPALKAAWLGAVDAMVGRLAGRLASGGGGSAHPSFILAVTGDHSTPAVFGDHSVEPVPFAAAPVSLLVKALGGAEALVARYGGAARLEPVWLRGGAPPPPPSSTFPPVSAFDEASAAAGNLGRFPGRELMPLLARMAGAWGGDCGVE